MGVDGVQCDFAMLNKVSKVVELDVDVLGCIFGTLAISRALLLSSKTQQ